MHDSPNHIKIKHVKVCYFIKYKLQYNYNYFIQGLYLYYMYINLSENNYSLTLRLSRVIQFLKKKLRSLDQNLKNKELKIGIIYILFI